VTLVRCSVEGNVAGGGHRSGHEGGRGGAIANFGTVTVIDSTLRGNRAGDGGQGGLNMSGAPGADGGAIHNRGNLIVAGSTFSGNAAGNGGIGNPGPTGNPTRGGDGGNGGAIANFSNLTLINSTISGNSSGAAGQTYSTPVSDGAGGGIYNKGSGDLGSVTIAHNTARNGAGGGVATSSDGLRVADSILAANTAGDSPDCSASAGDELISEGYNLVARGDGCNWTAAAGDQIGTLGSPIDAALGPLRGNGGPTFTHALSAASPAVDGGDPAGCEDASGMGLANDQRGNPREQDGDADGEAVCDIGAFELEGASD
jgi:hypothetical protein